MLNSHSKAGIATIVFYVPAVICVAYLFFHRHGRPRMPWYFLLAFSCVRVGGGVVTIFLENHPGSVGLIIAAIILLGVGVIPLLLATIGLIRVLLVTDYDSKSPLHRVVIAIRALFFVGLVVLITGGSLVGNYHSSSSTSVGSKLVRAGYLVIAGILALLIAFQCYLLTQRSRLSKSSITILIGTLLSAPFQIVRITYALLSAFSSSLDVKWNVLYGSVGIFVAMSLLMEYVVVVIYIAVGFAIPSTRYKTTKVNRERRFGRWARERRPGGATGAIQV